MYRFVYPLIGLALTVANSVCAEESAASAPIEEIVVAGFRDAPLKNIDSSATVLGKEAIDSATLVHFEELVQLVPNMNLSGEGSRARYFQLRGVGEREQYEGAPNPSVGFIVDDIDLSGIGGVSSLFDIDRVDILRGPQSSRFGSSAMAGLVYMQSAMPGDEVQTKVEMSAGSDEMYSLGAAIGGPLGSNVSGRLSGNYLESNGFRDNQFLDREDTNGREELTVRGKLRWQPGDWDVVLAGLYADFDNGYDAWVIDNGDTTYSDAPGADTQETAAASLKVTGPLGRAVEFASISSYANSEVLFSYDGDWGSDPYWDPFIYDYEYRNPRDRDVVSQEFRLLSAPEGRWFGGSTDWLFGVYVERLEESNRIVSQGDYIEPGVVDFCQPDVCFTDRQISSNYRADSYAVFTGIDSALTTKLGFSFGLRYEYWDAQYSDSWQDNFYGLAASNSFDPDDKMLGGHVALSYDWTDDLRGYARIARGYKAGGFNPSLAAIGNLPGVALGPEFIPYQPEYLWNYELGLKGLWLGGRLSADLSVFYMDRDNAQLSQSSQQLDFDPNSFVYVTSNGEAHSYGLEASTHWQIVDFWAVHGSLGLLQSKVDDYAVRPEVEGRELAHAPPYTASLGTTLNSTNGWFARLDLNAVGDFYFDVSHDQKSDAYEIVNLKLGKEWDYWSVYAWGRNIFDEDYAVRGFYFGNDPAAGFADTLYTKFGDPAQYGLTVSFSY